MDNEAVRVTFAISQDADYLRINLEDFVLSLNKNLMKTNSGEAFGKFERGVFTVTIKNSSVDIVKSYIDAFVKAMRKNGCNFILNVRKVLSEGQEGSLSGHTEGEKVNRKNLLTKVTLLECSLKDATKKK